MRGVQAALALRPRSPVSRTTSQRVRAKGFPKLLSQIVWVALMTGFQFVVFVAEQEEGHTTALDLVSGAHFRFILHHF